MEGTVIVQGADGTWHGGCLALEGPNDAKRFIEMCAELRFWPREATVHAV